MVRDRALSGKVLHGTAIATPGTGSLVDTHLVRTHIASIMNVTLSIDEQVVTRARQIAAVRGTSLNQLIRDYLEVLTRPGEVKAVLEELDSLRAGSTGRSQGPWTRDELHERR